MPIVLAPLNTDLRVVKILTDDKTRKHLASLGITVDSELNVLSHSGGSTICMIKESRLALDKSIATKILVRV